MFHKYCPFPLLPPATSLLSHPQQSGLLTRGVEGGRFDIQSTLVQARRGAEMCVGPRMGCVSLFMRECGAAEATDTMHANASAHTAPAGGNNIVATAALRRRGGRRTLAVALEWRRSGTTVTRARALDRRRLLSFPLVLDCRTSEEPVDPLGNVHDDVHHQPAGYSDHFFLLAVVASCKQTIRQWRL